jgi:hypothetical protein
LASRSGVNNPRYVCRGFGCQLIFQLLINALQLLDLHILISQLTVATATAEGEGRDGDKARHNSTGSVHKSGFL